MRPNIFRHLYSQIVIPLVVAALAVGVVATVVAVYFLSNLTDSWVDEVAGSVSRNLVNRVDSQSEYLLGTARLAASDLELADALLRGDHARAHELLEARASVLDCDTLMLVDSDGRVVAGAGVAIAATGDRIVRPGGGSWAELVEPQSSFMHVGDDLTITAMHAMDGPTGGGYVLLLSELVDEALIRNLGVGAGCGSGFYAADFTTIAWTTPEGCEEGSPRMSVGALSDAFSGPVPGVIEALEAADEGGEGFAVIDVSGTKHRVVARKVNASAGAESEEYAFIVSLISQQVSDDARTTTTNLITMWSVVAVLALVGLGGWVARRVSDPIIALSEGAQRIADGDFSTKIPLRGNNEITELATNFNQMTESLKDRSGSLTKKVLELATLYEMSRALGATLDMDELLESVLDSALRIFGADLGYVTMRDQDTGELKIRARSGAVPSRVDDRALRSSMSEWVIRESRPLIFNPTGDHAKGQVEVVTGAMAALCVPLVSSEGAIGAITVGSQDPEFRFASDDVRLLSTIANHVTIAIGNIDLFSSLQEAYLATVRSLAAAVDAKDPYTRGHSEGVALYSTLIAEAMDLSHDQRIALEMAAYLHDIGKIGIKEEILLKPGRLTDEEMSQMRHHPLIGANILKPVAFPWPIVPVVRHHHERWDGDGYPAGLKGEEIPLLARILTAADAYEAMIADRPYRRGRTMEEGVAELERCSGEQFDPTVVEAFVGSLAEKAATDALNAASGFEEEVGIDEARAIFVALCEGMLVSFRRLGGPRLAANVESALNEEFGREDIPVSVSSGKIVAAFDSGGVDGVEIEQMRLALRVMDHTIGRMSGHSLVDHFHADAMSSLSERMRRLAIRLEFQPT